MNKKMDIIISLVGYNPIPNYASILNYCKGDSTIYLITSSEDSKRSTKKLANNLKEILIKRYPNLKIEILDSNKSNFRKISEEFNRLVGTLKDLVSDDQDEKIEIILDITGSTKANSVLGYSILNNAFENNKNIRFYTCYVSYDEEKIYQSGYQKAIYMLDDLAMKLNVTKDEVLFLYGYEEYQKINNNLNIVKNIYIKNFSLIFHIISKNRTIQKVKSDMFIALDICEKLGGNLSIIFFEAYSFIFNSKELLDEESGQDYFIKILENGTNKSYRNKITLKSQINGFCNNEEIEEFINRIKGEI